MTTFYSDNIPGGHTFHHNTTFFTTDCTSSVESSASDSAACSDSDSECGDGDGGGGGHSGPRCSPYQSHSYQSSNRPCGGGSIARVCVCPGGHQQQVVQHQHHRWLCRREHHRRHHLKHSAGGAPRGCTGRVHHYLPWSGVLP
jgi:hypothetical protein